MEVSTPISYPGLHRTVSPPGGQSNRALHLWAANGSKCFPCFVAQFREAKCLAQGHLAGRVPSYWRGMCPTPTRVALQLAGSTDNREAHGSHTQLAQLRVGPPLQTRPPAPGHGQPEDSRQEKLECLLSGW